MSAETDAWRLAEARRDIGEFTEKFSAAESNDVQKNLAVFYMGKLSAILFYMSDTVVTERMKNDVPY